MPWTTLPNKLSDAGLCMTGYPQVPFPGEVIDDDTKGKRKKNNNSEQADANKQGIKVIGTANARILLHAFQTGMIKVIRADKTGA